MRMFSASIIAAIVALPLVSAAGQEPPSSLDPGQRGTVNLSHAATRVVACSLNKQKQTCTADKEPADSSSTVTLSPIITAQITGKDKREPVQVSLPKDGGVPQKLVLGVGVWEVVWPGRSERDRFFVAENDEFDVKLSTQIGTCKKAKDTCNLRADQTQLQVKIPQRCKR
ncbi:MAG: hypothetical protein U0263_38970 [Polyangiaceae bacterium]